MQTENETYSASNSNCIYGKKVTGKNTLAHVPVIHVHKVNLTMHLTFFFNRTIDFIILLSSKYALAKSNKFNFVFYFAWIVRHTIFTKFRNIQELVLKWMLQNWTLNIIKNVKYYLGVTFIHLKYFLWDCQIHRYCKVGFLFVHDFKQRRKKRILTHLHSFWMSKNLKYIETNASLIISKASKFLIYVFHVMTL